MEEKDDISEANEAQYLKSFSLYKKIAHGEELHADDLGISLEEFTEE